MTEPARSTYPTLARVEARGHQPGTPATTTILELTFALDELDELRTLRDVVGLGDPT